MKTLFTFALAGLLSTGLFSSSFAEDLAANSEVKAKFKKVNVLLKEGVGKVKVVLMDKEGKILHTKKVTVTDQQMILPYDLNDMPCGAYQVKITTDEEEVVYDVATFEKRIAAENLPLMAYGKVVDQQTLNLSVIGLEEPGVEVSLKHNLNDKTIFSEYVSQKEGFRKNYKLRGISPEDVYFELKDAKGRSKKLYF
ncbi:hypothetical protein SAMN04488104_103116 [Algoriphagus faecimaris]|uniref:Por secretion system C-terminal sorting domain-containing protein n=1 Tax=Algoriphagus faecimaris TaxID=686796 RepID=A0A1G6UXJ4_9BACT|nr:hypothetical protein [Algoriphagus faecimaris]SDD46090.1 hypothetical protein SAMN04488104_103116 [Algoriphagus faecimaris]